MATTRLEYMYFEYSTNGTPHITTARPGGSSSYRMSPKIDATSLPIEHPADIATVFDASAFPDLDLLKQTCDYPALVIPAKRTAAFRKKLRDYLLHRPGFKTIFIDPEDSSRRILLLRHLDQNTKGRGGDTMSTFSDPGLRAALNDVECNDIEESSHSVSIGYEDLNTEEVLRKIIPLCEIPTSFETVGTIAHLNLRDEFLPYKFWIGKVILDKNSPRIKTVVNKLGSIENEFRTFGMEVIAGSQNAGWSEVTVKEEGFRFTMDFRKVYWNSRLISEHKRLVRIIQDDVDLNNKQVVVADLMAGVGPFAVPLAGKGQREKRDHVRRVEVFANDLNPDSYKYLKLNAENNGCGNSLQAFNMDARDFVRMLQTKVERVDHVLMNLPASAPEFLDAFRGWQLPDLPRIHVHCFCTTDVVGDRPYYDKAIQRCEVALGCGLDRDTVQVHEVRDVAPQKYMLCISFRLPDELRVETSKHQAKRVKVQ